jgi:SAM-dependent methyltransferase
MDKPTPNQDNLFAASEADRYFDRNKSALREVDWSADPPLRLMELYRLQPRSALEIGAANGCRLAAIAERWGTKVTAVEPSAQAIADGQARFPEVRFLQATASAIPLQCQFDLVIVNFVLHWIARETLLRSIAEIDRLLVAGGCLILGDFAPSNRVRVRYHHRPEEEIYTYKQNYPAVFLASGLYHTVAALTSSHGSPNHLADVAEHERTGVWLLRKLLVEHYVADSTSK